MLFKYLTLASALNFLLLAIATLMRKGPYKKANTIMGFLFSAMALYSYMVSFLYIALSENDYSLLIYYFPIDGIFLLLMAPCLYFYIRTLLNKPVDFWRWKMLLHLIPIVPFIIFNLYFATLTSPERIGWFIEDFWIGTLETNMLNVVLYTQIPTYLYASCLLIRKQLLVSSEVQINGVRLDVSWLKTYLIINLSFLLFSAPLCFYFANDRADIIIGEIAMNIQFVYIFFKSGYKEPVYLSESVVLNKNNVPALKIDDQKADKYLLVLQSYMLENKPYLDEGCNLQMISENINISVHQLSNILNTRLKKSFPEFINEYRILEAKQILNSNHSLKITIEAVGLDCGFGSKSSFNKAFKKHTLLTPSEFRELHKLQ